MPLVISRNPESEHRVTGFVVITYADQPGEGARCADLGQT